MITDYIKFVLQGLKQRRLRSWLTVIGILIGVTAVVALISLGNGMNVAVNELFESVGSDKVIITPGGAALGPTGASLTSAKITDDDLELIEDVRGVEKIMGILLEQTKVQYGDETKYTSVVGLDTSRDVLELIDTIDFYIVQKGRQLKNGDRYKAVVGYSHTDDFFEKPVQISDKLTIGGQEFQVVGLQQKSGSPIHDPMVRIPLDTAREIFDEPEIYSMIFVQVKNGVDPAIVAEDIEEEMRKDRNLDLGEEDFSVETAQNTIQGVSTILVVLQVALIGIASISIVVGGIGIMNTTYTSVFERTNEIGIMKAIGAKNSDIVKIFLVESGVIGLIGGVFGVGLGALLAKLVEFGAGNAGFELLKADLSVFLIVGALIFSFGVGALSGVLPALKAAKLNTIEAIEHG